MPAGVPEEEEPLPELPLLPPHPESPAITKTRIKLAGQRLCLLNIAKGAPQKNTKAKYGLLGRQTSLCGSNSATVRAVVVMLSVVVAVPEPFT